MGANSFQLSRTSSGIATPQNLDPFGAKYLSFGVTGSSSGTFSATVEGAVQDLETTSSASVAWFAISSAITANSSMCVFLGPLSGVRLNVSAASSCTVTVTGVQGIGW